MYRQPQVGAYKTQQILTASPLDLVILTYDAAIAGCGAKDMPRVLGACSSLRSALDFKAAPELAPRLLAIYEYCEECVRGQDFESPGWILQDLRSTWVEVRRRLARNAVAAGPVAEAWPTSRGMVALSVAG